MTHVGMTVVQDNAATNITSHGGVLICSVENTAANKKDLGIVKGTHGNNLIAELRSKAEHIWKSPEYMKT